MGGGGDFHSNLRIIHAFYFGKKKGNAMKEKNIYSGARRNFHPNMEVEKPIYIFF